MVGHEEHKRGKGNEMKMRMKDKNAERKKKNVMRKTMTRKKMAARDEMKKNNK